MYAFSVITGEELHFDDKTTPEYAAAYGYCEQHNLISALFAAVHDKRFGVFFESLNPTYGKHSVCVGDWVASTDTRG